MSEQTDNARMSMAEFLTHRPPGGEPCVVEDLFAPVDDRPGQSGRVQNLVNGPRLSTPRIRLHCPTCDQVHSFDTPASAFMARSGEEPISVFLHYRCCDCREEWKTFALRIHTRERIGEKFSDAGTLVKIGELPAFGPPTPGSLLRSFSEADRAIFLKGRRCESQSLGIAAFAYYRRIVETQKNWIFDRLIAAVKAQPPVDEELVAELSAARSEIQFTSALDSIKHALPKSLLISGQSPLRLLHAALSVGVHELTDTECLSRARNARIVLARMVELTEIVLNDDRELAKAVAELSR